MTGFAPKPSFSSGINPSHYLARGLEAAWMLDDMDVAQIIDKSPNRIDGTPVSGPTMANGNYGRNLATTSGGSRIDFGNPPTMLSFGDGAGNDTPYSMYVLCMVDNVSGNKGILTKDGANREWFFGLSGSSLSATLRDSASNTIYIGKFGTASVTANVWNHIVVTYNGNKANSGFTLWLNGVDVTITDQSSGSYTGSGNKSINITLGAKGNAAQTFPGTISNAMIWKDRILKQADLFELMADPFCVYRRPTIVNEWIGAATAAGPVGPPLGSLSLLGTGR